MEWKPIESCPRMSLFSLRKSFHECYFPKGGSNKSRKTRIGRVIYKTEMMIPYDILQSVLGLKTLKCHRYVVIRGLKEI